MPEIILTNTILRVPYYRYRYFVVGPIDIGIYTGPLNPILIMKAPIFARVAFLRITRLTGRVRRFSQYRLASPKLPLVNAVWMSSMPVG